MQLKGDIDQLLRTGRNRRHRRRDADQAAAAASVDESSRLSELLLKITDKRNQELDPGSLRRIKALCKKSGDHIKAVHDYLLHALEVNHAQVRVHRKNILYFTSSMGREETVLSSCNAEMSCPERKGRASVELSNCCTATTLCKYLRLGSSLLPQKCTFDIVSGRFYRCATMRWTSVTSSSSAATSSGAWSRSTCPRSWSMLWGPRHPGRGCGIIRNGQRWYESN